MRLRLLALTLLSAVLFPIALPSELFLYGNPFLGLFALSFYYVALTLSTSRRESTMLGVLFGAVSTVIANYWLMYFGQFSVWTLGGVTLGYIGYNALLAPFLWRFLDHRQTYRPFVFAIAWTGYEYLKSVGYLGYPWGLSAYPFGTILPLVQQVDIAGVWSLCFLAVSANSVIGEAILLLFPADQRGHSPRTVLRQALFVTSLVALSLAYGYWRMGTPIPIVKHFSTVLVQQNSDSWISNNDMHTIVTAENLSRKGIAQFGTTPDLVVWSETSLQYPFAQGRHIYESNPASDPFIPFLKSTGTYLLTGSPYIVDKNWDAMNSTILLSADAKVLDYYGKQHLVPFAESFPFWDLSFVRKFVRKYIGLDAVWVMGNRYTIFHLPLRDGGTLSFGTPICFEDAFGNLVRHFVLDGADVLINLTNNSWSETKSAQTQHFVAARFRAIENRRTLVRSTNSGVSSVIDAYGRVIAQMPMFTADELPVNVPVYKQAQFTPYTLYGDYLPILMLVFLFIVLLVELPQYWLPAPRE